MDKTTDVSEPASDLERLIADLSGSGPLVFVFGDGFCAAHLKVDQGTLLAPAA